MHLQILSEAGIINYILYLFIFIIILKKIYQSSLSKENKILFITYIMILLFPFKPTGNFYSSLYGGVLWYQIGLFLFLSKYKLKI